MPFKWCLQYVSKFGKLSSGHRNRKGQFSFQSQRKAVPKNVQITAQLHSSHMLANLGSKSFNLGFSSSWTESFQMYKLSLEKAEEPETKLPTFAGSWRKQENFRKNLFHWLCQSLWLCGSQETLKNSTRDGNTKSPYLPSEKSVCTSGSNS